MKKLIAGLVMAAALVGCGGGSVCDDLADADKELGEKASACAEPGEDDVVFNKSQCEANEDKCNDDEKEALSQMAECLGDLPTCSPASEQTFTAGSLACLLGAYGKVGQTCLSAVGLGVE